MSKFLECTFIFQKPGTCIATANTCDMHRAPALFRLDKQTRIIAL
jgi:hypothetical protein